MTRREIIGWKTYVVAVVSIVLGVIALGKGHTGEGLKGIVFGCALISIRDAMGKILRAIDGNRASLDNVRAIVESLIKNQRR